MVWTHTELDGLAALALYVIRPWHSRPKIIANCVWLFDRWNSLSKPRRAVYRKLLEHADVVTTFSPSNLKVAENVLPGVRCEYIAWGAATGELKRYEGGTVHRPLRIVSLGSDIHRDWETLARAFGNDERYAVRIGTGRLDRRMIIGLDNISLLNPRTADDIKRLYEWADVVVVSLKANLHASGITVILEAVILGVPVVCTDSEGLRAYFSPAEVRYVPPRAPVAMRRAAEELATDDKLRAGMVARAQNRLSVAELTSQGFADRLRRLSGSLLLRDCP
jgi:glycosyltransferase involved in cell wall biosynthesis